MKGNILSTGQTLCYDVDGRVIQCAGTGQDGEFRYGRVWPSPRFVVHGDTVIDKLTDLVWSRDANPLEFPLTWPNALQAVARLNAEGYAGYTDWRLPNRRELRSLMSFDARKPALPTGHPFENVFLGWYWSSTSAAIDPDYAWYVHMEGARMFYGRKDQYYLVWPVRGGESAIVLATGQCRCYDVVGGEIDCAGSGQDGELRKGLALPTPRFRQEVNTVVDLLTGLRWLQNANVSGVPVDWQNALIAVQELNRQRVAGITDWRLPNINELEALVDCSFHSPALTGDHPFTDVQEVYWSATTSFFETDWSWALYMHKGATGVGHKRAAAFYVWAVAGSHF